MLLLSFKLYFSLIDLINELDKSHIKRKQINYIVQTGISSLLSIYARRGWTDLYISSFLYEFMLEIGPPSQDNIQNITNKLLYTNKVIILKTNIIRIVQKTLGEISMF